jgi:PAS domain S-box-containing protein
MVVDPVFAEHAFITMFGAAPYGCLLVNQAGQIVLTNAQLDAMFGYLPGELAGQVLEQLVPDRHRASHVARRDGYAANPSPRPMGKGKDLTGVRKDGIEIPIEIGLSAITTPSGRLSFAIVIDITDRKRTELKLRETNGQLEEFTHVASHDLRSPIRGIATLISFIQEDYGNDAPAAVQRNLDRMASRVAQMERVIEDLLSYARAGRKAVKQEPIMLRTLIAEVMALEDRGPGVRIDIDVPDESFQGARTPLTTVLRNLIGNAINHHDRTDITIVIKARFDASACVIEVIDDGPGIPEIAQLRVFRLFQTLAHGNGSGLGLAVVQRLVDGHGGTISVHSIDGRRGTRFCVHWPRFARSEYDD